MRLRRIVIDNFLSYGHAELDFTDIRKALIVGMNNGDATNGNNSGKSNLFQAIGWAVWGESKAKSLDQNVRWGTKECSVELWFEHDGKEVYVKRTRNSDNGTTGLAFTLDGVDSSSGKSSTKTEQKILEFIKLDYLTYVNSVYIRQNDMYSLANPEKPNQGREVLEQILRLDEYDGYEKTAKVKIKDTEKSITESAFFVESNKDIDKKIEEAKNSIVTLYSKDKEILDGIEEFEKKFAEAETKYNLEKIQLESYKSINEQIVRSNATIASKNQDIERDKLKGKAEVYNRETRKANLAKKIEEKPKIEAERTTFLAEMEISYANKKEFDTLNENLIIEKQTLGSLETTRRAKDTERIGLEKDVQVIHVELDKIKLKVKNIKVQAGEKCESCMRDVTEHSIEDIKKHYREEYVKKIAELEPITKSLEQVRLEIIELEAKVLEQTTRIGTMEKEANVLRGKIITQKQYEDRLMAFSSRLSDIGRYEKELEELPENKIIDMLTAKIKQTKTEIANEEKHLAELQTQLSAINVDVDALKNLENTVRTYKNKLEDLRREKYTNEANVKNFQDKIVGYEFTLSELIGHERVLKEFKKILVVLEQLEKGFGSKGARAKIVEDSIRELETEANIMLKRLSNLSISFITEREGKIVFDVDVHDGPKTLAYCLYAGSEHFRIAFSLRIALAKLLMGRAKSKLDFLLIDEADASLDEHNAEEIVNIINELQDEFHTILCISHRNDIKSQFDNIITVLNDGETSTIV